MVRKKILLKKFAHKAMLGVIICAASVRLLGGKHNLFSRKGVGGFSRRTLHDRSKIMSNVQ